MVAELSETNDRAQRIRPRSRQWLPWVVRSTRQCHPRSYKLLKFHQLTDRSQCQAKCSSNQLRRSRSRVVWMPDHSRYLGEGNLVAVLYMLICKIAVIAGKVAKSCVMLLSAERRHPYHFQMTMFKFHWLQLLRAKRTLWHWVEIRDQ